MQMIDNVNSTLKMNLLQNIHRKSKLSIAVA